MQVKEFKLERPGGLRLHTLPFATGRRVLGTAAMLPPAEKLDTLLLSGSSIELLKTCPKVLKGSGTAKRGDIWISQIGTGKIVATASLVGVRRWASLPDSLHTTLRERLQEVGYTSPHVWDMEGVTLLPEPWHIPPAMRKGCQHWIPKERWNAHAQSSRKRTVPSGKAWPKKFPRKSKTQSEGSCLQQSNEFWKKHARPRPGQRKKKKHRNAPAAYAMAEDILNRGQMFSSAVQRLQAGRTAERLDHLATMSLFHERQAFDANPLPRPGRCARWKGNLVYIVACFARRSLPLADILPLEPAEISGCWTATRTQVRTCPQKELSEVGCKAVQLQRRNLKRGRLHFQEKDMANSSPCLWDPHAHLLLQTYMENTTSDALPAWPVTIVKIQPQTAKLHTASAIDGHWHRVVAPCHTLHASHIHSSARNHLSVAQDIYGDLQIGR